MAHQSHREALKAQNASWQAWLKSALYRSAGPAHRLLRTPFDPLPPDKIGVDGPCAALDQMLDFEAAA
eukprot:1860698-Pyramimonas_sp.AAC.1